MSDTRDPSNARDGHDARDGRTDPLAREVFHTTLRVEPTGENAWKATEPESDTDIYGRGSTPPEAVKNYAELVRGESE